eukprot:403372281
MQDFVRQNYQWTQRELYGGAFFHQIAKPICNVDNMSQYIIELLEHQVIPDEESVQYHFNDLVECNKAETPSILNVRKLEPSELSNLQLKTEYVGYLLKGTQIIIPNKKVNDSRDFVTILMLLLRIPQFDVDVLLSLNIPDKTPNAQGHAQGSGDSEEYKQHLVQMEAVFQESLNTLSFPDMKKIQELFAVEQDGDVKMD